MGIALSCSMKRESQLTREVHMRETITISTYQPFPSGAWVVAAIVKGYLTTHTYMGYTKREAIREFKREIR